MRQSAGRVGNCWDNSVVESFFASLKRELVARRRFATREEARREIFAWIGRYNAQRLHSSLTYQTPTEWEDQHRRRHEIDESAMVWTSAHFCTHNPPRSGRYPDRRLWTAH